MKNNPVPLYTRIVSFDISSRNSETGLLDFWSCSSLWYSSSLFTSSLCIVTNYYQYAPCAPYNGVVIWNNLWKRLHHLIHTKTSQFREVFSMPFRPPLVSLLHSHFLPSLWLVLLWFRVFSHSLLSGYRSQSLYDISLWADRVLPRSRSRARQRGQILLVLISAHRRLCRLCLPYTDRYRGYSSLSRYPQLLVLARYSSWLHASAMTDSVRHALGWARLWFFPWWSGVPGDLDISESEK